MMSASIICAVRKGGTVNVLTWTKLFELVLGEEGKNAIRTLIHAVS